MSEATGKGKILKSWLHCARVQVSKRCKVTSGWAQAGSVVLSRLLVQLDEQWNIKSGGKGLGFKYPM